MSTYLSNVTKGYIKYVDSRRKIKARQRTELAAENLPDLQVLGKAVYDAQNAGHRIEEIMVTIGVRNKNLLYDARNAYLLTLDPSNIEESTPDSVADVVDVRKKSDTSVFIRIALGGTEYAETFTVDAHGSIIDLPDEWLAASAEPAFRTALRDAISQTKKLFS